MANHAHSTRTPLLPQAGVPSALLPRGAGKQPGPVTLALRAMRTTDPDQAAHDAIEAIRRGLDRHFSEADHRRLGTLRRSIADRIEADLALLDMLSGDADLEDGHDQERENEHGGDVQDEAHDAEEDKGIDDEGVRAFDGFDGTNYFRFRRVRA
ncbi:hypothetical protein ACFZ8E_15360 [Methylobacterium sp. HMF5984]|uniref:hypothetical protein n=1 Tax=Methylobacterium sp. HMF5984 TaxID=3367370 RepID=UPI003853A2DB